jgi:molybdopterin-containing oxidoreductase family iron-sulfur binding subunit
MLQPGVFWNRVEDLETGGFPNVRRLFFPKLCMHCRNPACVSVCPTGASHQREDGIVLVDQEICIGCKSCIAACPYQVRYYHKNEITYYENHSTPVEMISKGKRKVGTVNKCNFCEERLKKGMEPACVESCPAEARYFGDLDDPDSKVSKLIRDRRGFQVSAHLGTSPSIYYLPD